MNMTQRQLKLSLGCYNLRPTVSQKDHHPHCRQSFGMTIDHTWDPNTKREGFTDLASRSNEYNKVTDKNTLWHTHFLVVRVRQGGTNSNLKKF